MLNIQTKRHIRFATVDKGTAWVVVAILIETTGNQTVAVSEPKVIKIIPKKPVLSLTGHTAELTAPNINVIFEKAVPSPFISILFGNTNTSYIASLGARPPTLI